MEQARPLFVLLTVPHAECSASPHETHDCDFAAPRMAVNIATALSLAGVENQVVIGDINRGVLDQNRRESRGTEFRKQVRELAVQKNKTHNIFLLDIHSYPKQHDWGRTGQRYPMVFLYAGGRAPAWVNSLSASIYAALKRKIAVFDNIALVNDIMDEAHSLGIKAVLMEFNESNAAATEQTIATAVGNWAKSV